MKNFTITEIVTTDDGRIILNGPKGSIDVRRGELGSVAQFWRTPYEQTPDEDRETRTHRVTVSEVTDRHGLRRSILGGGPVRLF